MQHADRWTKYKIAQRIQLIQPLVYRKKQNLPPFRYKTLDGPAADPPTGTAVDDSRWQVIEPNTYWGTWNTDFVMRTTFAVPSDWAAPVALYLPLGDAGDFSHPEVLAYIDGEAYAAADRHHHDIYLRDAHHGGKTHQLTLHGWTGRADAVVDLHTKLFMRECAVVQVDVPTREFVAAARVAHGVAEQLDDHDPVKGQLYNALDQAFVILDTRDPLGTDAFYDSVPEALKTLKAAIAAAGSAMSVDIVGIGHAHIDVAWLWTITEVIRKSGRTFSTVLHLMEQFPEYKFSQSQAQLYRFVEDHYPPLFEGIKKRVAEGRWEVMGGTWVEPDCNAIGAESLARQFLLGRSYFRKHFGDVDTPVLWLPDTFGYSWALPQLIKQAGMAYFITHKMSWNQYNHMPNQIFWWQGLDGTKVLTHFLTTLPEWEWDTLPHSTTYNGLASPKEIFRTWQNFRQKETHNELITAYGYGDGGGGPNREMLENIQQFQAHPGAPRVRTGTVREFLENIAERHGDDLPVWNGEFYLEYHRGTYTSQAKTKRNNRKSEFLMHDAEFAAAWAALSTDFVYPQDDLQKAWELICLNQFHDILPGSSIAPVYVDSDRDYEQVREIGESMLNSATSALMKNLPEGATLLALNSLSFGGSRIGLINEPLDGGLTDLRTGSPLLTQPVQGGTLLELNDLEPYSIVPIGPGGTASAPDDGVRIVQEGERTILENTRLRVEFDARGELIRIYDRTAKREVLAPDQTGNMLLAFEDRPMNFDAWDIDVYIEDRVELVSGFESLTVVENGPLRAGIQIKRRYRSSVITQTITLQRNSKRLDFDTQVDWHEQHILLKAAFPVNVFSPVATYEVQWGNVQRPTHRNSSWDWARFEVCAHKWADLSEGNYGVALLNDCKYGYEIHDNDMRLTLIKSATYPDPQADQGTHVFTYSLLPHEGDWRAGVVRAGYDLNDPLILRRAQGRLTGDLKAASLVQVDADYALIETVKGAEDGRGIIVRLYEQQRNRGTVTLTAGFPLAEAHVCNLLEEDETSLPVQENRVQFNVTPYQIVNLRLVPKS